MVDGADAGKRKARARVGWRNSAVSAAADPAGAAGRQVGTGLEEKVAMSVISGLGAASPADRTSARPEQPAGGFAVSVPVRARAAEAPAEPPAVLLAGLLALQAEDCDDSRDRNARRRGQDLLAQLAALQRALLSEGGVPVDQLRELERLAADAPPASDPHLREIMDAITLRVRVELARFRI
jgi:Class II flagellar assembly regulator